MSMSDDLFWPPVSGQHDDEGASRPDATGQGHDLGTHPTEPLFGPGDHDSTTLGGGAGAGGGGVSPTPSGPGGSRGRWRATAVVAAASAFVFGAGGAAAGVAWGDHHDNDTAGTTSTTGSGLSVSNVPTGATSVNPKSYAGIAAKVLPSVVSVNVTGQNQADTGSGIVLRSDGYILTNNHVVAAAEGGGTVSATFNDGSSAAAKIVGTDSLDDLAVIRVAKTGLKPVTLGSSSAISVGDPVLAIGSPLGLSGTVTSGIVSALNRPVETQDESQQQQANPFGFGGSGGSGGSNSQATQQTVIDAIQTDAAINPGNSGGPLVDSLGQVVGINSAIASLGSNQLGGGSQSGNIGVGFAIPINEARVVANELITTGKAVHPLLGVSLAGTNPNATTDAAATVEAVTSGGPAAKAGIAKGDVITAVDGVVTPDANAVIAAIRTHQPGQQVTITVKRGGSTHSVTATLTQQSSTS
jgi:putative serine protease PepD